MRITNTMRTNSTLNHINRAKISMNDAENRLAAEKKITRPSDDPIIAIRALSLRSSLSQIDLYLSNVKSAESWLKLTESSLDNIDGVYTDILQLSEQGSSDQFTLENRSAVIEVLQQYKSALYDELDTSYAGRYIFSGYKTDSAFTFQTSEDANKSYEITQSLSSDDITQMKVMTKSVAIDTANLTTIDADSTPETVSAYRMRLAYSGCSSTTAPQITVDGTAFAGAIESVSYEEYAAIVSSAAYETTTNTVYYIHDTGELAFTDDLYTSFKEAEDIAVTYQKDSFAEGDVRPEMYFNCKDITDAANPIDYVLPDNGQKISYTINFNQTLQINTLGNESVSFDFARDIDDLCNALQQVADVESKISELKAMKTSSLYTSNSDQEAIASMIEASEKELEYAKQNMEDLFSAQITKTNAYQQTANLQISDLGARSTRLTLAKSRLTEQQTTFKDLKSKNEDIDLEEATVEYSSAGVLYEAALVAASNVVKQTLLNYI